MTATTWHAAHAWLPDGWAEDVTLVAEAGRFTSITVGDRGEAATTPGESIVELTGVVLPGFANAHSHAFHRALRGRTHGEGGSFWTWREAMYDLAARLDLDTYRAMATATYAEMALAGVTAVGEFHYLHHGPHGQYDDPNAVAAVLVEAASAAGIRLTLLDTCYLAGGLGPNGHLPLDPVQKRFSDGDAAGWRRRFTLLADRFDPTPSRTGAVRVGAAIHSVRAVAATDIPTVVTAAEGRPLHVHLSEQPSENSACQSYYGVTPTTLLGRSGVLGPTTTAVHATHLTDDDISLLGASSTFVCFCPTTERDLADGIGPARRLLDSGSQPCLGSDQHAVTDLLEEARALEMNERLASGERGRFELPQLVKALTVNGQRSIGWDDAGELRVGARADLVAVRRDSRRTAGSLAAQIVMSASAADVDTVIVDGRTVVEGGRHVLGNVGGLLQSSIEPLWR
ncbi:MAG: formimidoylglutamate deiminase [Actinomycetota bacterium]|nr:formimidoylglutamate deiminase [Actinomycetota bacterium]